MKQHVKQLRIAKRFPVGTILYTITILIFVYSTLMLLGFLGIIRGNSINNKIQNTAERLRSPAVCNLIFLGEWYSNNYELYGISASESRYYCKAEVASTIGINSCYKLDKEQKYKGLASQQYVCFSNVIERVKTLETCNELPIESYPVIPRYECYSKIAEQNADVSICNQIPESDMYYKGSKLNCLLQVGRKIDDPEVCSNLSKTYQESVCLQKF